MGGRGMTLRQQFYVTMRGRRVTVLLTPLRKNWGEQRPGTIRILSDLDDEEMMDTVIHEVMHAYEDEFADDDPEWQHQVINDSAEVAAKILFKLGFRREEE